MEKQADNDSQEVGPGHFKKIRVKIRRYKQQCQEKNNGHLKKIRSQRHPMKDCHQFNFFTRLMSRKIPFTRRVVSDHFLPKVHRSKNQLKDHQSEGKKNQQTDAEHIKNGNVSGPLKSYHQEFCFWTHAVFRQIPKSSPSCQKAEEKRRNVEC